MSPEAMRQLVERYIDAYNRKDVDGMLHTVHPAVIFENVTRGQTDTRVDGVAALRALAESSARLFSQRQQTIDRFDARGATAVAEITFQAIAADDLPNGVRKGQPLHLKGRSEFHFLDGLISRITDSS